MRLRYHLVNVFTRDSHPLSGNPLCAFEDGTSLSDEQMQALARQFNLSETTFLFPSSRATRRVRIFTPDFEMPFAGHPTLGSAHVVRSLLAQPENDLTLEMLAGVIPVRASDNVWTLTANPATWREVGLSRDDLATAMGVSPEEIIWETAGPRPLWVDAGSDQLLVPLRSAESVRTVRPDAGRLASLRNKAGRQLAYVFSPVDSERVLARFLFEAGGAFREDPATGSACANLGGWYVATGAKLPLNRVVSQGEQIHRPSTLYLSVTADARVHVGGEVIRLGAGEVDL